MRSVADFASWLDLLGSTWHPPRKRSLKSYLLHIIQRPIVPLTHSVGNVRLRPIMSDTLRLRLAIE